MKRALLILAILASTQVSCESKGVPVAAQPASAILGAAPVAAPVTSGDGKVQTETVDGFQFTYTFQPGPTNFQDMQNSFKMESIDSIHFSSSDKSQLLIVDVEAENSQTIPEDVEFATWIHDAEGPPDEPDGWARRTINTTPRARALFVVPQGVTRVESKVSHRTAESLASEDVE